MISRIQRIRSYAIDAVQIYDNNTTEAIEATQKPSALFGYDNAQYVLRSREQIQPITISPLTPTPTPQKINK